MICIFPDPYPDELLYSVCARYHDIMQYPNSLTATNDFFGNGTISAVVDLPNRLEYLVSALPPGHLYTVDQFIDEYTMFPLYSPFLSSERAHLVREDMCRDGDNRVSARIGLKTSYSAKLSWLRFCPVCVEADRKQFGETYWHRIHQVSGVQACPYHTAFLENSSVSFGRNAYSGTAISAESVLHDVPVRLLDLSERTHSVLLDIARNAAWLLRWRGTEISGDILRERYYNSLLSRGLAYYNRNVRAAELIKQFCEFYPPQVLKSLDCEIENTYCNWLLRLLHSSRTGVTQLPIRHILLILFLGLTTEEFFTLFEEFKPFGDGPWPCLNRAADHFSKIVVTSCRITDNIVKGKLGRPMGIFSCECGFVYNRVGPDKSDEDRFSIGTVESYGPVWEKILLEAWPDTAIPVYRIAQRLSVSHLTVVRHAIRLKLPMNVPGARAVGIKTVERYKNFHKSRKNTLERYRNEWLSVLATNREASRNELIAAASFLYLWLNKNDSDWLEANLPPVRKFTRRGNIKDWKTIDVKLARSVRAAVKRIGEKPGRPKWVCLSAIIREVGHKVHIEHRLDKLPHTATTLCTYLESLEAYMIRKIEWAEACYRKEGYCPTRNKLMTRAVVRNKTGNTLPVQNAIDAAMRRLVESFPESF
jgi:hypothetical protein